MTWTYWGLWHQYTPAGTPAGRPPTIFLTNGKIDWYDLAHGKLAAEGASVPTDGWWVVRDPVSRRLTDVETAKRMQLCAPVGPSMKPRELWWTDEEPLEYPYRGEEGPIILEVEGDQVRQSRGTWE